MSEKFKIQLGGKGLGLGGTLFIVFLILKLTKVINWSWIWIFAPLCIPIILVIFLLLLYFIIGFIDEMCNG